MFLFSPFCLGIVDGRIDKIHYQRSISNTTSLNTYLILTILYLLQHNVPTSKTCRANSSNSF